MADLAGNLSAPISANLSRLAVDLRRAFALLLFFDFGFANY